jgi:hypothetical protein
MVAGCWLLVTGCWLDRHVEERTCSPVILRSAATKDLLLVTAFTKADPSLRSG